MRYLFLLLIFTPLFQISAQNMQVVQDAKVKTLVEEHKKANAKVGVVEGFRVQIFFDSGANSRTNAESARSKFSAKYPNIPAYLTFKEPNFKLRVGDFRTRSEARGFLKMIYSEYPNAFVIKDEIKYPPLENTDIIIVNE